MKCILTPILVIVSYFLFTASAVGNMNQICNYTDRGDLPIDSLVLKNDGYIHVFINRTVISFRFQSQLNTSVFEDLSDLFKSKDSSLEIESPIDISYTVSKSNESNEQILKLINLKAQKQWDIDFKSYEIIGSRSINISTEQGIEIIDYLNIDDTNGYKLYLDRIQEYIYVKKWNILEDREENERYFLLSYEGKDGKTLMILSNHIMGRRQTMQLNREMITSAIIFNATKPSGAFFGPVLALLTRIEIAMISKDIEPRKPFMRTDKWCYLHNVPAIAEQMTGNVWLLIGLTLGGVAVLLIFVCLILAYFAVNKRQTKGKKVKELSLKDKSMTIASEDKPLIGQLGEDIQWRLQIDSQSMDSNLSNDSKRSESESDKQLAENINGTNDRQREQKSKKTIESEKTLKLVPRKRE